MEISLLINVEPFCTPDYVIVTEDNSKTIPLTELSVSSLEALCYQFKAEVFRKANKSIPPIPR